MSRRLVQPNKKLAILIQELLDLPDLRSATLILRSIVRSMKGALLRGEKIYIRGFGTFKTRERIPQPTPNNFLTSTGQGRPSSYSTEMLYHKPRRAIIFEPALPFMSRLNVDSPNYKERRSQLSWRPQVPTP